MPNEYNFFYPSQFYQKKFYHEQYNSNDFFKTINVNYFAILKPIIQIQAISKLFYNIRLTLKVENVAKGFKIVSVERTLTTTNCKLFGARYSGNFLHKYCIV